MARAHTQSRRSRRIPPGSEAVGTRTKIVWAALLISMTGCAGLLMLNSGGAGASLKGLTLTPLVASGVPASIEGVFETRVPLDQPRWRSIVIHHSRSPYGSPDSLDREHRAMNLRGLGYHFVIGNGNGMGDGEIHVGSRWLDQQTGAHAGGARADWYDSHSIGICLVGNGDRRPFSRAQITRLVQLTIALARRLDIPADAIELHSDIAPTSDPGWYFPEAAFREQLTAYLD